MKRARRRERRVRAKKVPSAMPILAPRGGGEDCCCWDRA